MGKNKNKSKTKNVFKVVGAKSLKNKNKAKPVNVQLKKINNEIKEKIQESNDQLQKLEEAIRQTTSLVTLKKPTVSNVKSNPEKEEKLNKDTDKNISDMEAIQI